MTDANPTDSETWRGVVSGSSIAWTKVLPGIDYKYLGCRMVGVAYVAPVIAMEETTTDTGLTGRNGVLVLSSTTGKWTSDA